jgi:hypothetical protein
VLYKLLRTKFSGCGATASERLSMLNAIENLVPTTTPTFSVDKPSMKTSRVQLLGDANMIDRRTLMLPREAASRILENNFNQLLGAGHHVY